MIDGTHVSSSPSSPGGALVRLVRDWVTAESSTRGRAKGDRELCRAQRHGVRRRARTGPTNVSSATEVIASVGSEVPAGLDTIDGTSQTLLPGLIDAHTHAFGNALERALQFGVTTELDMFTESPASRRRCAPSSG